MGYHLIVGCGSVNLGAILSSVIGGFGSGPGGDDDGCDSADGSPSPREGSGEPIGLAPSGVPDYMTDTGLRMSAALEETRLLGTPSTAATATKRSREADLEQVFKTPRTGSSSSSAAAFEETPDTAVAGSSAYGSSAAALSGILAQLGTQLGPIIRALKATDPSHIDEGQLASAKEAKYLLGSFESMFESIIDGVEAQREAIRNPPPAETPLNFDNTVHTLSFLDCKSLATATAVSRHFRRAAPEAVKLRLNYLSGAYSCYGSLLGEPPTAQLLAQVEWEFKETPALIQRFSLSQTALELKKTKDELHLILKVIGVWSVCVWKRREIARIFVKFLEMA